MSTPSGGWAGRLEAVRWLGPGFVLAATAVGASHLVLAPTAGARFGYALLWVVLFSHAVKYPAFEFGPRFAVATGTSLLDGYRRVPGPANWALWLFLCGTVLQGVTVLAGVLGVASAVALQAVPAIGLPGWSLVLGLAVAALLATGGFDGLSALSKWMLGGLTLMTVFAFLYRLPGPDAAAGLVPSIPPESAVLVAALLGWMPTGVDVSVWHSMWALERRDAWRQRAAHRVARGGDDRAGGTPADPAPPARDIYAVAQLDTRLGYGLSVLLGIMFLVLGAEVLRPVGQVPQGADVAISIGRLFTESLGDWVLPLFLIAAFFGMFSTAYGVLDGFPRAFSEVVTRLFPRRAADHGRLYWGFLFASLALALGETLWLPNPVTLVTLAAVVSFLLAPALCVLNHYCVTRLVDSPELQPGPGLRVWSWLGIAGVTAASLYFLAVQFG